MSKHNLNQLLHHCTDDVQRHRMQCGAVSPAVFASLYCGDHLSTAPAAMHQEIYHMLADATRTRGARLALAAPRASAKTTIITNIYTLWSLCYQHEPHIILISGTEGQAKEFITFLRNELQDNPLIRSDFPTLAEPPGRKPAPKRWTTREIQLRTGARITALGTGEALRGRKAGKHRPTLIICDDLEHERNTQSATVRGNLDRWFTRSVLNAGEPDTNIIVVGTIQHDASLLARLVDPLESANWTARVYRSVLDWSPDDAYWERWRSIFRKVNNYKQSTGSDAALAFFTRHRTRMLKGTKVLWPEREDYYHLMVQRETMGPHAFDAEKQNDPINPDDCCFPKAEFQYWEDHFPSEDALIRSMGPFAFMVGACDPSVGSGAHGDYCAIVTLLHCKETRRTFVLDADLQRRTPDNTIEALLAFHRKRQYEVFVVENNLFHGLMTKQLQDRARERNMHLRIKELRNTGNKENRIRSLQPLIHSGSLQFRRSHPRLLEQFWRFPKGAHDDGPDAIEMAVAEGYEHVPFACA